MAVSAYMTMLFICLSNSLFLDNNQDGVERMAMIQQAGQLNAGKTFMAACESTTTAQLSQQDFKIGHKLLPFARPFDLNFTNSTLRQHNVENLGRRARCEILLEVCRKRTQREQAKISKDQKNKTQSKAKQKHR